MRFLGWFILFALVVGLASLLSYSLSAVELVRSDSPAFAAWWELHQFLFMEGAATALGLLLGIAVGGSLVAAEDRHSRTSLAALAFAIVAFIPIVHTCDMAARLGWNGREAALASWLISRDGYEVGRQIDKVVIAGVYFVKTIGLAFLSGLGLTAIACAAGIWVDRTTPKMADTRN